MTVSSRLNRLVSLARVGLFTSIFFILELTSKLIINPLSGYSVNLKIIWYIIVLLSSVVDQRSKLIFALLAPVLVLVFGFSGINFFQVVFEYLFAYWSMIFLTFCQLNSRFMQQHRILKTLWLFIITTLAFSFNFLFHYLAGVLWWTNYDYWGAFVLNLTYIVISYIIGVPVILHIFLTHEWINCKKIS